MIKQISKWGIRVFLAFTFLIGSIYAKNNDPQPIQKLTFPDDRLLTMAKGQEKGDSENRTWFNYDPYRVIIKLRLPNDQSPIFRTLVVAEGDFETRSMGSFSVRLYQGNKTTPQFDMDNFLSGQIHQREGEVESIALKDLDGDKKSELIVVIRSGSQQNFYAFSLENTKLNFLRRLKELPADVSPISALSESRERFNYESSRFIQKVSFSEKTVVVAEGSSEPRSIGSFSVRLYAGDKDSQNETSHYLSGLIHERDGGIESVIPTHLNGDLDIDIVVTSRSAGSGSRLTAYAFTVKKDQLIYLGSLEDLPAQADPVALMKNDLQLNPQRHRFISRLYLPNNQTLVVERGIYEPSKSGSFSVKLYEADPNPLNETAHFLSGLIHEHDENLQSAILEDLDGDQNPELVVVAWTIFDNNDQSVYAFTIKENKVVLWGEVKGIPIDADPVAALKKTAK